MKNSSFILHPSYLTCKPSTIHRHNRAVHIVGSIGREKDDDAVQIFRGAPTSRRNTIEDGLVAYGIGAQRGGVGSCHIARRNRVDVDVVLCPFVRERARQARHCAFEVYDGTRMPPWNESIEAMLMILPPPCLIITRARGGLGKMEWRKSTAACSRVASLDHSASVTSRVYQDQEFRLWSRERVPSDQLCAIQIENECLRTARNQRAQSRFIVIHHRHKFHQVSSLRELRIM